MSEYMPSTGPGTDPQVGASQEPPPEPYIGAKIILARPMNKKAFYLRYGESLSVRENNPDEEDPSPGYLVIYPDGYRSWSPKDVFDNAYRKVTTEEKELIL